MLSVADLELGPPAPNRIPSRDRIPSPPTPMWQPRIEESPIEEQPRRPPIQTSSSSSNAYANNNTSSSSPHPHTHANNNTSSSSSHPRVHHVNNTSSSSPHPHPHVNNTSSSSPHPRASPYARPHPSPHTPISSSPHTPRQATPRTPKSIMRTPATPRIPPRTPRTPRTPKIPSTPSSSTSGTRNNRANGVSSSCSSSPSTYLVALVELRNRLMLGLAAIDIRTSTLELYQYADTQMYTSTLALLHQYDPTDLLLSDTSELSPLFGVIKNELPLTTLKLVKRKYFDEGVGLLYIEQHCTSESRRANQFDTSKYLCLAAAACLTSYVEHVHEFHFAPKSLRVVLKDLRGQMRIDAQTTKHLELVINTQSPFNPTSRHTLYSVLNQCKTHMGSRLLRTNLLQPLKDEPTIKARYDTVDELLHNETVFFDLITRLPHFTDLEHLIHRLIRIPKIPNERTMIERIVNIVQLKRTLSLLPELQSILSRCSTSLMKQAASVLASEKFDIMTHAIDQLLESEERQRSAENKKFEVVFAVRSGINGLLDVARSSFCEAVEDLHQLASSIATHLSIPTIRLNYTSTRGYHLCIPLEVLRMDTCDIVFRDMVKRGNKVFCTTEDINSLNLRQMEAFHDVANMTGTLVEGLLNEIHQHLTWMALVSDSLALVDMLLAFASVVTSGSATSKWVRPQLVSSGPIAIKIGRHPIIESVQHTYTPNDIYLSPTSCNMNLITGPNQSGKSTYLRQVGVLTVMAHIGCYLPADHATVRITDQLFMNATSDKLEFEADTSAFFSEMQTMAHILKNADGRSLVLLDETGRSTSNTNGLNLAWSICESLALRATCLTLCATHYMELCELSLMYGNIKNLSCEITTHGSTITFTFHIIDGPFTHTNIPYGIYIAKQTGIPNRIINDAYRISMHMRQEKKKKEEQATSVKNKQFYSIIGSLLQLKHSKVNIANKYAYLQSIATKFGLQQSNRSAPQQQILSNGTDPSPTSVIFPPSTSGHSGNGIIRPSPPTNHVGFLTDRSRS